MRCKASVQHLSYDLQTANAKVWCVLSSLVLPWLSDRDFFAADLRSGVGGELAPPALGDDVGLGHRYLLGQAQPESKRVSLKGDPK